MAAERFLILGEAVDAMTLVPYMLDAFMVGNGVQAG